MPWVRITLALLVLGSAVPNLRGCLVPVDGPRPEPSASSSPPGPAPEPG